MPSQTAAPASRRSLISAAYAGMFVFGMVMTMLGAILPLVAGRLRIDLAAAGGLFSALGAAMLVSGFAAGPVMDRFGKKIPLVAGCAITAVAVSMLAVASSYSALAAGVLLLGFGGGAVNNTTNALVSDLYDDPRQKGAALNLLGAMFGIGALALPFAIGRLVATAGLEAILYGASAMSLAAALWAALPRYPRPAHADGFSAAAAGKLMKNRDVLALGASLFCQSGNEFVMSGFLATFFTTVMGASVEAASYMLALYWAAILVSRLAMSRVLLHVPGPYVLVVAALGSAAGIVVLSFAGTMAVAVAGTVVLGLCISCIFATTLGVAGARFKNYLGTVFGILFGMSLAGGMTLPAVFGRVAQASGLRLALLLPAGVFCAIAAIHAFYTLPRINVENRG